MAPRASDTSAPQLIADASVWINLAATGRMEEVLGALSVPVGVSRTALCELERGKARGYDAFAQVEALVGQGLITTLELDVEDEALFLDLVSGDTAETLDDGEAATLALAFRMKAVAAIDERKATALAGRRFSSLIVRSTTELLFDALPYENEGGGPLAEALFEALRGARMRVPAQLLQRVAEVLGAERVQLCRSLPASILNGSPSPLLVGCL